MHGCLIRVEVWTVQWTGRSPRIRQTNVRGRDCGRTTRVVRDLNGATPARIDDEARHTSTTGD